MDYEIVKGKVYDDDRRRLSELLTTTDFTIYWVEIKIGNHVGDHYHKKKDETIGIISGVVKVHLIDIKENMRLESKIMNVGDKVTITNHMAHALENMGDTPVFLVSYATKPFEMDPITLKGTDDYYYKVL